MKRQGFSLFEMSIVLAIIALVTAGGLITFTASMQKAQLTTTRTRLVSLQKTLYDYWIANGRLPCPSSASAALSSASFGQETTAFTCAGATVTTGNYVSGAVPVKVLGLSEDDAMDAWGNRIRYVLYKTFAASNAVSSTVLVTDTTTYMTIVDGNGQNATTQAVYVLLSPGPNGHGAYARNGAGPKNGIIYTTDELNNCDCGSNGVSSGINGTFKQRQLNESGNASLSFDDVLVYGTRSDLSIPSD